MEITANLWRLAANIGGKARFTLVAGRRLMGDFPDKVRTLALRSLTGRGVEVIEGTHLKEVQTNVAVLKDGRMLPFDMIFLALGVRPAALFGDSGLPTGPDGGLLVNNFLSRWRIPKSSAGAKHPFQPQPLDKVGVSAVRETPSCCTICRRPWRAGSCGVSEPGGDYLLIFNLGDD